MKKKVIIGTAIAAGGAALLHRAVRFVPNRPNDHLIRELDRMWELEPYDDTLYGIQHFPLPDGDTVGHAPRHNVIAIRPGVCVPRVQPKDTGQ